MHVRAIQKEEPWGLFDVSLLEVGVLGDDSQYRRFQVSYAPFLSEEDAQNGINPQYPNCHLKCLGSVVDEFFYIDPGNDPHAGQFLGARSTIMPYLIWYLSKNPTEEQLERCPNMKENRKAMAGVVMFPGTPFEFVVTELPAERPKDTSD